MITGKYQAYPEYKDSESEWLGVVPADWPVIILRRSINSHKQGYYTTEDYVDEGIKLLRITDLRSYGKVDFSDCPKVPVSDPSLKSFSLKNGDVVFARTGGAGTFGVVSDLNEEVVFASYLIRFRFSSNYFQNGFLRFLLLADSTQQAIKQNIHGGVNQNIHAEDIKNATLVHPSLPEQQQIANFLDHETAKIDRLISKQQQLIELLKEKRQAVISHAVTKGLNPNLPSEASAKEGAPLKPSGVEWLGDVPENWSVKRLNLLFSESNQRASTEEELNRPILSVSIHNGISDTELSDEELDRKQARSEDRSLYKTISKNDLSYNMMRAWQGGFGASSIDGLVSPAYVVCSPKTDLNSYYFELVLRTQRAVTELKRYSRGDNRFSTQALLGRIQKYPGSRSSQRRSGSHTQKDRPNKRSVRKVDQCIN